MRTRSSSPRAAPRRSISSPTSYLAPRIQPGDEIVLIGDGASFQHRAVAFPARAPGRGAEMGRCVATTASSIPSRCRRAPSAPKTKLVAITPYVECARHHDAAEGDRRASRMPRACPCWPTAARARCTTSSMCRRLDVDFYAITGHKLYGPTGIGALYAKRTHLKAMRPFKGGGEMIREVTQANVTYADPPMRFEAGTPPIIESGRAGGGARLSRRRRPRRGSSAHEHDLLAVCRAKRLKELNWRADHRRCAGQGRRSSRSRPTASTRTISPPSSTAKAWRCAAAIIAPSR